MEYNQRDKYREIEKVWDRQREFKIVEIEKDLLQKRLQDYKMANSIQNSYVGRNHPKKPPKKISKYNLMQQSSNRSKLELDRFQRFTDLQEKQQRREDYVLIATQQAILESTHLAKNKISIEDKPKKKPKGLQLASSSFFQYKSRSINVSNITSPMKKQPQEATQAIKDIHVEDTEAQQLQSPTPQPLQHCATFQSESSSKLLQSSHISQLPNEHKIDLVAFKRLAKNLVETEPNSPTKVHQHRRNSVLGLVKFPHIDAVDSILQLEKSRNGGVYNGMQQQPLSPTLQIPLQSNRNFFLTQAHNPYNTQERLKQSLYQTNDNTLTLPNISLYNSVDQTITLNDQDQSMTTKSKYLKGIVSLPTIKNQRQDLVKNKLNQIVSQINLIKEKDLINYTENLIKQQ